MKRLLLLLVGVLMIGRTEAQIVVNEASYRNFTQVSDASGNNPDWIELYNSGDQPVSLWRYHLSDDLENPGKWTFPDILLEPKKWLLIYASGRGQSDNEINHWETAVRENDTWSWINPVESTPASWMQPGFDDSRWNSGPGGFGYGDGDDVTVFPLDQVAVYTRISFQISDLSKILAATLHVDYDDGFVAYLNGKQIAMANMGTVAWNSKANASREALMFQGKKPEAFELDMNEMRSLLHIGENVLAVEVHNFTAGQIDMSLRAFLSFGLADSSTQFGPFSDWLKTDSDSELHTNFKISSSGETLYLSDNKGVLINSLTLLPDMPVNSSCGSESDGSAVRAVFLAGTPGASNETQMAYTEGFEPAPLLSLPGGFYPAQVEVAISSPYPDSDIRYTTNGLIPTATSNKYTGLPVVLSETAVLKARCFSIGHKLPGPVVTATYFIAQNPTPAAVLSITMETGDLYGETGIYDNWWTDWKKRCYIEYFEQGTHQPVFKQYAGIKIDGGAGGSRSQPQRSFRIEPGNGALGDGDVKFPLIPDRTDRLSYATFYIRNGSNQYLYYPCKDAIETKCMGDSTLNTYSGYAPVQVYLNGDYWGYYELREKLDEDYFNQYFGTDPDSLEVLSVSYFYGGTLRAVTGKDPVARFNEDFSKFLSLNSFNDTFWDLANELIDLEYYTDYICAQTFMANVDWPYNNIRIFRNPQTGNKWMFSLIDLEWSLAPNGWSDSNMDHIRFMLDYDPGYPYIRIWQKAMQNRRYREYFINRFSDLMNTVWQGERLTGIANKIYSDTRPELPATFKRWGDQNVGVTAYMNQFDQAHQTMISELSVRSPKVRTHIKNNFSLLKTVEVILNVEPPGSGTIRISTIRPESYPWSGSYFDRVNVKIEALPNPGYVFVNWDANALITDVSNAVFLDTLTRSTLFRAHFKEETYSEKLVISEVNYHSEPSRDAGDWIEIWNFDKVLTASLNGWYFTDEDSTHVFRFPENTLVRPDERLIIAADPVRFRQQHPGIPFIGAFSFGLGGNGDAVLLYNYKKDIVSSVAYQDVTPWPLGPDGQGRTLELRSEVHSTGDPSNWFDGCIGGSPGRPYSPCAGAVIFSEINYKSDSGMDHGDWVELRNISDLDEDISGWSFRDGVDSTGHAFLIPQGTILKAHQNIVLVQDTFKFRSVHPGFRNLAGPFEFGLKDKGEWIRAYDASGRLRLSVRYNDIGPWPLLAGGMGYTLEVVDSTGNMNDGNNWMTGCIGGSPGAYYASDCSGSGVREDVTAEGISVYPNPASDRIRVTSSRRSPMRITLRNIAGETVLYADTSTGEAELTIRHLPAGSYLLTVQQEDGKIEKVLIVKQ